MSFCKPAYRKIVNEQEKQVNRHKNDDPPPFAKFIIILVTLTAIATFIVIKN